MRRGEPSVERAGPRADVAVGGAAAPRAVEPPAQLLDVLPQLGQLLLLHGLLQWQRPSGGEGRRDLWRSFAGGVGGRQPDGGGERAGGRPAPIGVDMAAIRTSLSAGLVPVVAGAKARQREVLRESRQAEAANAAHQWRRHGSPRASLGDAPLRRVDGRACDASAHRGVEARGQEWEAGARHLRRRRGSAAAGGSAYSLLPWAATGPRVATPRGGER